MGKKKIQKKTNSWDKKRLIVEVIVSFIVCFCGIKYGQTTTQITYNGDVVTYEIYSDTIESIQELNKETNKKTRGEEIANFAIQFEGNPYVYGGTSLTKGADSSGFVSEIYRYFGFAVPHSSQAIKNIGTEILIPDVCPGDIVCYSGHVAIYIGDNKVIHASNAKQGIIVSDMFYRTPQFAIRIAE